MSSFGSFRPELWEATNQQNNMNHKYNKHSFGMCNFPCKPKQQYNKTIPIGTASSNASVFIAMFVILSEFRFLENC